MKGTLTGIIVCFLSIVSFAQKTVRITGKVTESAAGTPVVSASIIVEGSGQGVKTDVEGGFFLSLEPGKKYNLRISSVGFQTKEVNDYQPLEGDNAPMVIELEKATGDLGGVIVKTSAKRESVASLYTIQKNSSAISDAISAEVIKKSPDRNTSEVLRRVSGASIQDNKFVIIRGLSERYNTSMLNNSILPSTEPDKKAFSFDIIPSSLIDNITIYKSPTPDLPGDFAGGGVKISTRDYPARKLGELSFNMGYNTQTTFRNFYKGFPEGKLDWLGFFDDSRLIPGSYYRHKGASFINQPDDSKLGITKQFPNTYGYQAANQSQPNFTIGYTGGDTKLIRNNKIGFIYSVNYSSGRRVANRSRDEYEAYESDAHLYSDRTTSYDMRSTVSALANITYSYGRSKISLKNLYNNDFVKTQAIRYGTNTVNAGSEFLYKSTNTEATANGIGNSVLEGLHSLNKGWTIDWNGSYGITYRWQPDQKILSFKTIDANTNQYYLVLSNENSPDIINAGRLYSFLKEDIYGANINATKQFQWKGQTQKFRFGTSNYYRNRDVEVNALGFGVLNSAGSRVQIAETKTTSFNTIFDPANIDQYKITYANIGTASTDYTGKGLLNSGYALLDNKFSDRVKMTWGVRAEKYLQQLNAKGKSEVKLDNTDILPSFLFTYALNTKTNFRVAGSQSVNRPEFRELAAYRVYDYENDFIVLGNSGLQRSKTTNADLRYEWYPASGEIISASVFYKYFDRPIEQTNEGNNILSYRNADNAKVYGVEMELRKKLDFINSALFNHLTFYANAAFIKGSVQYGGFTTNNPLQGQSPYLINGGLSYTTNNDNLSFNLLYNRIGSRLKFRGRIDPATGVGLRSIYEKPRDVIDFQLSKKFIHNRFETRLTISDLLGQSFVWYDKFEQNPSSINYNSATDRISNSYNYGTTVSLGLRYNFK